MASLRIRIASPTMILLREGSEVPTGVIGRESGDSGMGLGDVTISKYVHTQKVLYIMAEETYEFALPDGGGLTDTSGATVADAAGAALMSIG